MKDVIQNAPNSLFGVTRMISPLFYRDTPAARGARSRLLAEMIIEALRQRGIALTPSRPQDIPVEVLTGILCRCGVPERGWRYPDEPDPMPKDMCPHLETDERMDFDPNSPLGKSGQAMYSWKCLGCGEEKTWTGPAPESLVQNVTS
jgi:hypothetical protein